MELDSPREPRPEIRGGPDDHLKIKSLEHMSIASAVA
jgi:hypothetical protein